MPIMNTLITKMTNDIWCDPTRDFQNAYRPTCITSARGITHRINLGYYDIPLPVQSVDAKYMVFLMRSDIGYIGGLRDVLETWISAEDIGNHSDIITMLYDIKGRLLPKFLVHYYLTRDNAIIIAIRRTEKVDFFTTRELFVRFYQNALFWSDEKDQYDGLSVYGTTVTDAASQAAVQTKYQQYSTTLGHTLCYRNGYLVDNLNYGTLTSGDVIEMAYDSSISKIVDFPIEDMKVFTSEKDGKNKYIVHLPKAIGSDEIEYYDDIDWYLIDKSGSQSKGIYYYRNAPDAVRMLTHCDYSIPTDYVSFLCDQSDLVDNVNDLTLRAYYRNAGNTLPLPTEATRLNNMYHMSDEDILGAMVGVDSTLEEWKAANLENSKYVETMRLLLPSTVDVTYLKELYGYHGIVNLVGKSIHDIKDESSLTLPAALRDTCTVYEYGPDRLLDSHTHVTSSVSHSVVSEGALIAEILYGEGSVNTNDYVNVTTVPILDEGVTRVYRLPIEDYVVTDAFQDITHDDRCSIADGVLTIADYDSEREVLVVRNDSKHLFVHEQLTNVDQVIDMTVNTGQFRMDEDEVVFGVNADVLPYLNTDVYLNDNLLIEDVHYAMDWPRIIIHTSEFRLIGSTQDVKVRGHGLLIEGLSDKLPSEDKGYVSHGYLSRNNVYNIRKGQSLRFNVGGKLYLMEELDFGDLAESAIVSDIPDGTPYEVVEVVQPIHDLDEGDPYAFYSGSADRIKRIENYLTARIPQPDITDPTVITPTIVSSPFLTRVLYELQSNVITNAQVRAAKSSSAIIKLLKRHEYMIPFDPSRTIKEGDLDKFVFHPFPFSTLATITPDQREFLVSVAELYFSGVYDIYAHTQVTGA